MSLKFLYKSFPDKKRKFSLLSKTLGKERHPMFLKTGPLWKQKPIFRSLIGISFGVPSKRASLQVFLIYSRRETEMFHFQNPPSFTFQSPRYSIPLPCAPDK
jgi:hypothetical protein